MYIKNSIYKRDRTEFLLETKENARKHVSWPELPDQHYIQGHMYISAYHSLMSFRIELSYKTEGVLQF